MDTTLEDILRLGQQLTTPDQTPQQMQVARPSSIVGLLGNALGGGSSGNVGLTQDQADAEGRAALLNFGLNMLEGSGYSQRRRSLGQIVAGGIRGAQGAIGDYESQLAARQAALQAQQQQSLENRFKGIDAASKIAEMQQKLKQLQLVGSIPTSGPGGGTSVAGGDDIYGLPKDQFLAAVAKRESGGDPTALNYVAKADPSAWDRGATATGKYQMVAGTWRTAAKLAGIDTTKYPRAMDAPEADQDRAASMLYDTQGTSPWNPAKFGQHWVKGEGGKYQLVQGSGPAEGGGRGPPSQTPPATSDSKTPPAAPAVQMGGPPPAPPGGSGGAYTGGGVGAALNPVAVKATPIPVGKLQSTGKPPGQAAANIIEGGIRQAQATPDVPGTVQAAGPAAGTPPTVEAKAEPGWGSQVGAYGSQPAAPATAPATPPAAPARVDTSRPFAFDPTANPPPQTMLDRANANPTKAEAAEASSIERGYTAARRAAEASGDAGKIADVERDFTQRRHDLQTRIDARVKAGEEAVSKYTQDAFNQQRDIYKENVNAEQTRRTNREQVDNEARKGVYTNINTESLAINDRIASLNNLRAMSDQLGPGTPLSDQQVDFFAKLGLGSPDFIKRMGTVQAFRAAANLAVKDVRAGMAMGGMSDRDLTFIENMIPNAHQDPYTRELVINMIIRGQERKQQMLSDIQTRMAGGMAPAQAIQEARKAMPPLFTQAPKDVDKMTPDERANWFRDNMTPRTLYRRGNGAVDIYWGPDGPPPGYERKF